MDFLPFTQRNIPVHSLVNASEQNPGLVNSVPNYSWVANFYLKHFNWEIRATFPDVML